MHGVERYLGLMSGTSADGIDAVIARFEDGRLKGLEATHHQPHAPKLREQLIALGRSVDARLSLPALATLDIALANGFAAAAQAVLTTARLQPDAIRAIGSHGQTVFHDPQDAKNSLQWGDPNRIAALTGIPVVADFRRMDIALGGQGAPLVPAFHAAVFGGSQASAIVNLGGIANITVLAGEHGSAITGFDCGPANALMDEWVLRERGSSCDLDGAFAAQGQVVPTLLAAWLAEPYFGLAPPKSTGRALFNLDWAARLAPQPLHRYAAADVQATLCELTANTVVTALPAGTRRLLVCGGGAFNKYLMRRLMALLPDAQVLTTEAAGLPPQWVEATAFAWLAHQRIHNLPGNVPSVTGAARLAVLGGVYGERPQGC